MGRDLQGLGAEAQEGQKTEAGVNLGFYLLRHWGGYRGVAPAGLATGSGPLVEPIDVSPTAGVE
jgi:hypothetical protein